MNIDILSYNVAAAAAELVSLSAQLMLLLPPKQSWQTFAKHQSKRILDNWRRNQLWCTISCIIIWSTLQDLYQKFSVINNQLQSTVVHQIVYHYLVFCRNLNLFLIDIWIHFLLNLWNKTTTNYLACASQLDKCWSMDGCKCLFILLPSQKQISCFPRCIPNIYLKW